MSALIRQAVLAKRQLAAEAEKRALKEREFLAKAKGDKGDPGPAGKDGKPGPKGDKGDPGPKGKDGKEGAIVLIRGGGGSGVNLSSLLPGNSTTEPAGIPVLQGGKWVNLPWSAFLALVGTVESGDHARRDDFVGESIIYRGAAAPGSLESDPVWKIKRIEFATDGDVTTLYAGGTAEFVHAWTDRSTLNYS